jgi:hypothetical protein
MSELPGRVSFDERFEVAEERHRARRKRTARIYRTVERVFFATLVVLAFLVVAKFASHVLPEYLG